MQKLYCTPTLCVVKHSIRQQEVPMITENTLSQWNGSPSMRNLKSSHDLIKHSVSHTDYTKTVISHDKQGENPPRRIENKRYCNTGEHFDVSLI